MPVSLPPPISEQIASDLRERIEAGLPLPARLTLPGLASHYRVSTTPVRQAVDSLIADGYLNRRGSGRLELARRASHQDAQETANPASFTETTQNDWETALVHEIVMRSLHGESSYLREEVIAARIGVGRTVLRQAFSRLAGRGLLVHVPRCGWRVRVFDAEDMRAYLAAREVIELAALDLAFPRLEAEKLEAMLRANQPEGDGRNVRPRLDNELHRYILQRSGNHYLLDFFDRHGLYYTFLFDFAAPEAHVLEEMSEQHRAILQALIEGNLAAARASLSRHIRAQEPIVARLMDTLASERPGIQRETMGDTGE